MCDSMMTWPIQNGGYKPLIVGLLLYLNGHVKPCEVSAGPNIIDGGKVLDLFDYQSCDLVSENTVSCACGHDIRRKYYVSARCLEVPVTVGMCCINRWTNPELVARAKRDRCLQTTLHDMRVHPERHCAWCGKRSRAMCNTIVHKDCRSDAFSSILKHAKQTPFVDSLRKQRWMSEKQWAALTNAKWWPDDQRVKIFEDRVTSSSDLPADPGHN